MAQPIEEFLNGGLVTARHPGLLKPGELQRADDCVYREKDTAIWRAPGRSIFNATSLPLGASAAAIKGLAAMPFDSKHTSQLTAYVGTAIYASDLTTISGTFAEVGGPGQVTRDSGTGTSFTAASAAAPFLATAVGAAVTGTGIPSGTIVNSVSGQVGTTGHYTTAVLSNSATTGGVVATFSHGLVLGLQDSGNEILEAVQWQGNYYGWFAHGAPYKFLWRARSTNATTGSLADILIARPMGLSPVVNAPTLAVITTTTYPAPGGAACSWNSVLGPGYYWFLITEISAPGADVTAAERDPLLASDIVESAYLAPDPTATDPSVTKGRPRAVNITSVTTQGVQVTFPAVVNSGVDGRIATNWGVYMYGPTPDASTTPSLAQFRRVGTPKITDTKFELTNTVLAAQLKYPTARTSDDGKSEFEHPERLVTSPDFNFAYAKSGSSTDAPGVQDAVEKLSTWAFDTSGGYASASIVGVEVQVSGKADPSGNAGTAAGYYVHVDTASKHIPSPLFNAFGTPYGTQYFGGPMDTLGVNWVISDLATISVTVGKTGTGSRQRLALDAVGLKIYFNGGAVNLNGPAYRVVTYRDQVGLTVSDPANLPPPNASTGDVWLGSLVLNDLSQEGAIRYSLPLVPESFPKPYVLQPSTRRHDPVTFIRSLNQILFVGFTNETKRINYLPRETDTDFQQGVAHEDLSTDHGVPGPLAGVKFDMPGSGTYVIYASTNGVYLTNGISTRPVNLDLDWANTVNTANLASCVFRVYTKEKWLVLYYNPAGASHTKNTKALVFSYAADKIKDGGTLPCTGPVTVSGRSSCEATISGIPYLFTGHETNGTVYVEDQGVTQASGYQVHNSAGSLASAPIQPLIRTRRIYGAGLARDMREQKVFIMYDTFGSSITATGTTTRGSVTVSSAAAFGSVVVGMRITGVNIDPGTIVIAASASSLTLSRAANATLTGTLTFDTGTIAVSVRGASLREAIASLQTAYDSTVLGDLLSVNLDHMRRGLELQFEKVVLPNASSVDLGVNLRIHQFVMMAEDAGTDQSRSTG